MKTLFIFVLSLFILQSCAPLFTLRSSESALQQEIQYLLDDPNLGNAYLGIYIESLDNGAILFRQNEHKLFVPASNMKLYTTAASLVKLGKDFQYKTIIGTDSTVADSTLLGNLIIRGSGDPSISGRYYGGNMDAVFEQWADLLLKKGIRRIKGNLIGDNSTLNRIFSETAGTGMTNPTGIPRSLRPLALMTIVWISPCRQETI